MLTNPDFDIATAYMSFAALCFHQVWDLIAKLARSPETVWGGLA